MHTGRIIVAAGLLVSGCFLVPPAPARGEDVIRLERQPRSGAADASDAPFAADTTEGRRGFDYTAFRGRLESLWFQRKALLKLGREADAERQSRLLLAFCTEQGIQRLDVLAGALLMEASRLSAEGKYEQALSSLDLAEALHPGWSQIHAGRALVHWRAGGEYFEAGRQLLAALSASFLEAWKNLRLVQRAAMATVLGLLVLVGAFSALMVWRYQLPLRHEVEEWAARRGRENLGRPMGWVVLLLPLISWVGAGWAPFYWLAVLFRFMRRSERVWALGLLVASLVVAPGFRVSVSLYGLLSDPRVRTTLEAAEGAYSPDRVVRMQRLVEQHPEDPVYRFLLAGLYKQGRYFEEAYRQYRAVLDIDPSLYQAHINIGNIFYELGQYPEAMAQYQKALDLRPGSALAYYNLYLTQSEAFHFREAETSLRKVQELDPALTETILSDKHTDDRRAKVVDASVRLGSVWVAALQGRGPDETLRAGATTVRSSAIVRPFANGLSVGAFLAGLAALMSLSAGRRRPPAQRCIRCGRAFCHRCRTGKQGREYCSQCLHLFVIGDGLAPDTKTRKLYEVERFERRQRWFRQLASLLLPGTAQILRSRTGAGVALAFAWVAALAMSVPAATEQVVGLAGLGLGLGLLGPAAAPTCFHLEALSVLGAVAAVGTWLAGNAWRLRGTGA